MESTTSTASTVLPRLLRADEVSAQTGESLPRVYELCRMGLIPHVRLGRSVRFSAEAIRAWIEDGGSTSSRAA